MQVLNRLNANKKFLAFSALCGIIFLDGVGLGIIFPLLVSVFWNTHLSILPLATDNNWRSIWYGVTLSVFPLGLFFSAPILGDLSDGLGRRKILLFAVLGVGIAYVLSAFAIIWHSLALLIVSRFFAGLLSGCQPIAQAAAMDISPDDEKAKYLSFIFFFSSVGFILGPILGGCLSNAHFISWFNLSTPLFTAALLSFLCVYLLRNFEETLTERRAVSIAPLRGLYVLREVWQEKNIRMLLFILLCYQISWSGFFQVVPAFLTQQYYFNPAQVGYYSSIIGLGFGIAFLGCIHYLEKHFDVKKVILTFFCIAVLLLLLTWVIHIPMLMWIIAAPLGFSIATLYVLLTTIGSSSVDATHQGWFMGATMSILAFAWFISPLINSVLLNWFVFAPMIFSSLMMALGFLFFLLWMRKH